ncbi:MULTISPECIES: hypothetical protein [unclassified Arenibacter]|uniref:hypothetical protein n=1 Tax=unclassified Arenibacter TaxID=2615047 RepID=UPI000E346A70|nr:MULTISPECIES: hypothetical protein [unclassified Arenibacter]MCM4165979.1 hypothetical protein [Arenibacter sp. A80]RFT54367.1 hypothetical protein D0S24_20455 [Arenibacter sp. P308M17]
MELAGNTSKKEEIPFGISGIITKIVKEIEVDRIYLNRGTDRHAFTYRLNIVTKLIQKDFSEQIRPVINSILEQYPDYTYTIFAFGYVNSEIQQGNLYFLNNCHEKDLVYKSNNSNLIGTDPAREPTKLYEEIKQDFKRDMSRLKSFKKGVHYFKTQKNLSQSAFMMHQTFEQGYRILERFICGRVKICHSIKNHQTYILKSLGKLEGTFQIESDSDSKLLDLLEDAYSSARYTNDYDITKNEIEQLSQKLGSFIKEIKFWFHHELTVFEKNITDNQITQHPEPETVSPNHCDTDTAHFVRKFQFDSSFEMLYLVRSLMNVCVTCLQEEVDPPKGVRLDFDIQNTLEFAIQLLPLKETSP